MEKLESLLDKVLKEYNQNKDELAVTLQDIEDYEEAAKIKNKYKRLIIFTLYSIGFIYIQGILIMCGGFIEWFIMSFSNSSYIPIIEFILRLLVNKITISLIPAFGLFMEQRHHNKALKAYKQNGSKYNEMTYKEISNQLEQLYLKKNRLKSDLEKSITIIERLKDEVEIKNMEEEQNTVIDISLVEKISYKDIHLKEYEIPKVKVKTRNEKRTRL